MPTFSPARAMGVPPQPYEDYYDNAPMIGPVLDNPTYSVSSVQSQPFAQPLALGSFDPVQDQIANEQSQANFAKRAAQQDILTGDTDWQSPDGRTKLQNLVARGVIPPQQARAIAYTMPKPEKLNKFSEVPSEVAHAVSQLNTIDPSDPNAMTDLRTAVSGIHPDIQSSPYFYPRLKEVQKEILAQKQHAQLTGKHDPDQDLINHAVDNGVDPQEVRDYLDENGKVTDPIALRSAAAKAKNNPSNTGESAKRLADLLYAATVVAPTDDEKNEWLMRHPEVTGVDKFTQAWNGVKAEKSQAHQNYLHALSDGGYKKLPRPQAVSQPVATPQGPPTFNTPQEAEQANIPVGTVVVIGGKRFLKN